MRNPPFSLLSLSEQANKKVKGDDGKGNAKDTCHQGEERQKDSPSSVDKPIHNLIM